MKLHVRDAGPRHGIPNDLAESGYRMDFPAINPPIEPHRGHWHIQDMIVVGNKGPQLLSDRFSTREMFVIE